MAGSPPERAAISRLGRLVTSAAPILFLFLGFVAMAPPPSTQVKMIATGLGAVPVADQDAA